MFGILLSVILIVVLAALLYDYKYDIMNWVGRIKIGTAVDEKDWKNLVQKVIVKWMSKGSPKVPINENAKLKLIKEIKSMGNVSSVSYWQDAAVLKAAKYIPRDEVNESADKLIERYIDIYSGDWKELPERIDCAMLSYEMMESPYIDNKTIEPAMDYVAGFIKDRAENYSTVPYNDNNTEIRFVDTVGMICPFLMKYAATYDKPEFIKIAMKQITEYKSKGFDEELNLPFHCYDVNSNTKLGICGWGRGAAWWAVGLVDSFRALLECKKHNAEKLILLKYLVEYTDVIKEYQNKNGSFGRILTVDSLEDSSAANMIAYCYSFMWSLTKNNEYRLVAEGVLNHIKSCTRRNGVIDYSQGDTRGIGFYSDSLSVVPAAQGFAVAAMNIGSIL